MLNNALYRLEPQAGETIDRAQTFTFTFEGRAVIAHPGDTIASALAAAGVHVISRSFKYHRPRGVMCMAGHCPNCLVQVGDEPNVRACQTPAEPDMVVKPQNVWPSLKKDAMAFTGLFSRFMPVGFYYKTFIRPQAMWPLFERILRRIAGLGKVNPATPPDRYDKQYLHTDVAVVGGGPAGLSAALAAAEQGATVSLFDENPQPGGHWRYALPAPDDGPLPDLAAQAEAHPGITVYPETTVLSCYEDNWLSARRGNRLFKIRAGAVIFATGAYDRPLIFDNDELPGVRFGGAAQRLLRLYGVQPGKRAIVVTANDGGWRIAAGLQAAGVSVVAVVDERPESEAGAVSHVLQADARVFWRHTIRAARGAGAVEGADIAPLDAQVRPQFIAGDLIVINIGLTPANGLLYQAQTKISYNEDRAEFLPETLPAGVFAAGRVAGSHAGATELAEGRLAGRQAAAFLGLAPAPPSAEITALAGQKAAGPKRSSARVDVPGSQKRFVCFCEDVTDKDLETAIAEGFDSIELLKRYSTISMGPCQGKMCAANTIHLCARHTGQSVAQTGTTTARPPLAPVSLGVLAGQNMEPVKRTALDAWHRANGAGMMVAGLWMRPEHYGNPPAEVQAVRERVGLIDVSTLGKLQLTGPGAPDFLDRIYVNKWQKLGVGRVRYGVMCNDEGVVMNDGVTARLSETTWYTTTTSSGAGAIFEWMQWWLQSGWGGEVHVTNISEVNAAFNLAGPRARAVLQKLTDADLLNEAFPYMHVRHLTLAGVACMVMRIGFTGELSYEIHCPTGAAHYVWERLLDAGRDFGIAPFGVEAQRILRLEKAHIIVGQDTDALSDPISADMAWAVKLDKADFLGQRPLRQVAQDGPAQRLVGFTMARPGLVPDEGLQIVRPTAAGPEIIGWVTSSRHSPTLNQTIGLCWLPAPLAGQPGATFTIRMNGKLEEARVHHGPFYDPQGDRLRI